MANYSSGIDALNALTETNEGGAGGAEFSSLANGAKFKVRAFGLIDFIQFYSYGIYKKVNSFSAATPSVKDKNGFAVANLTPWDKASEYYMKLAFAAKEAGDEKKYEDLKKDAALYRAKKRFAFGFVDLATGEPVFFDISQKQGQAVHTILTKNEKKLGKVAFELEKIGSSTNTSALLSVLSLDEEDAEVNHRERENFAKYNGKEFDKTLFDGLVYEISDAEQLTLLTQAGFDIALIGASKAESSTEETAGGIEIDEESLPF